MSILKTQEKNNQKKSGRNNVAQEEIRDLTDVIQTSNEINPFRKLGIEPWFLKSISVSQLRIFLSDYRRSLAKIHHPDKYTDTKERELHASYYKIAAAEIDRLMGDQYFLEQSLSSFRSGSIIQLQDDQIMALRQNVREERGKSEEIANQLERTRRDFGMEKYLWSLVRKNEQRMLKRDSPTFIFNDDLRELEYYFISDINQKFNNRLKEIFSQNKKCEVIEKSSILAAEEYIESLRVLTGKKPLQPSHKAIRNGNKMITTYRDGTVGEKEEAAKIVGSVPYFSIKTFLDRTGNTIDTRMFEGGARIQYILPKTAEVNARDSTHSPLTAFLCPFILPFVPLLIIEEKTKRGKTESVYELVLPVADKPYQERFELGSGI